MDNSLKNIREVGHKAEMSPSGLDKRNVNGNAFAKTTIKAQEKLSRERSQLVNLLEQQSLLGTSRT